MMDLISDKSLIFSYLFFVLFRCSFFDSNQLIEVDHLLCANLQGSYIRY